MSISQNNINNYGREFLDAMNFAGIDFKEDLLADGIIHRFANGNKTKKNGWYYFNGHSGAFGDWSTGIREQWRANRGDSSSNLQKPNSVTVPATHSVDQAQKYENAAKCVQKKWQDCNETGSSDYLIQKKIKPAGARFLKGTLVIPLKDVTGKIWTLQTITADGTKRFHKGGRKKECFHHIGLLKSGQPIVVTEGFATGVSVFMALKQTTVVAFDAFNLEPVIAVLKQHYPASQIIVAGDDDCWGEVNTGRGRAEMIAEKHGCSVVFPVFEAHKTKPTDFNDLHVLEGIDVVKSQIEPLINAQDWPEPKYMKCIKKDLPPVPSLPVQLLPEPYRDWLVDVAERMQCPLDYVAIGSLVVTASLIGAGCGVCPKVHDNWMVIPNLWGGIIGNPSSLKSPALKEVIKPLEDLDAKAFELYDKQQHSYGVEKEVYKASKEIIKKCMLKAARNSDSDAMEEARFKMRQLEEPDAPECKRYCANDATIEKMHELLSQNERGLLLFRDELMGLLANWEKEGHEVDRAFYLEAWNGYGSQVIDRIGRGTIRTKNCCVSLLGSTQPSKLLNYFQSVLGATQNDGLLQRFQLFVYPDERKDWTLVDREPNLEARKRAFQIMATLAEMKFTDYGATLDEGESIPYFNFDATAQDFFYQWLSDLEHNLRNNHDDDIIAEHFAKYRKLMPALALIFHLVDVVAQVQAGEKPCIKGISQRSVLRAAAWCDYLAAHVYRIYECSLDLPYRAARKLARKIEAGALGTSFDTRQVYRKDWALLKDKSEIQAACEILIESNWIRLRPVEGKGNWRETVRSIYTVNPKVMS